MTRSIRSLSRQRPASCETPAPEPDRTPGPNVAGASLGTPCAPGPRPDKVAGLIAEADAARVVATEARDGAERAALLARITGASVPSRAVALLIVDVYGLDCFTTTCLRRMTAVLDAAGAGDGD